MFSWVSPALAVLQHLLHSLSADEASPVGRAVSASMLGGSGTRAEAGDHGRHGDAVTMKPRVFVRRVSLSDTGRGRPEAVAATGTGTPSHIAAALHCARLPPGTPFALWAPSHDATVLPLLATCPHGSVRPTH